MLSIVYTSQFKKDFKRVRKLSFEDLKVVFFIIQQLEKEKELDKKYNNHNLTGNYTGFKECHIKPDLLLIYRTKNNELQLARIGTHSELF